MTMERLGELETGGFAFEVVGANASGDRVPPEWVQLTPRGAVEARDGRRFVFDPEALAAEFAAGGVDLPIDFDHETEFSMVNGSRPARGWIVELQARPTGLYGRVSWLPDAVAALKARAYRYISPTFWRGSDGVSARLLKGAALVTSPALGMPAVASAQRTGVKTMSLPQQITAALNLPDDASAEDAVSAIKALAGGGGAMASTLSALATAVNELNTLRHNTGNREVEAKVTNAIYAGRLPPSLKEWGLELCASNEAAFDTFIEKTVNIIPLGESRYDLSFLSARDGQPDTATDAMIARQLGVDPARMKS